MQLVVIVFTGEAWGYLGSRRFLLELDQQSDAVRGLNSSLIQLVMEIGSTGKGFSQGNKAFFAHTQLVVIVFTGEAWGYLGSRRFLLELDQQSDAVRGLNSSLIQLVFFSFG
ncbi:hypothetical protein GOBAR_AA01153 [Gossypium barbadense]|uniref:Uncharacterized protein n=1 Tax=Gossypium barbadense TaxID=3634 RepID=A0A2P5YUZ9_GOSBA|nr:hypothetical protein GOBAR_AA01153 [Gossypium barbadense]